MTLNLQHGLQQGLAGETWIALGVTLVLAVFVAYRQLGRFFRRRRLIAVELRLEAALLNATAAWGFARRRNGIGMASPFLGGLQMGPHGRVLSMRPLSTPTPAAEQLEPARPALAEAAAAGAAGAEPAVSTPTNVETVQQTQISCDI